MAIGRPPFSKGYHECPIEGCDKQVRDTMALCRAHWAQVPPLLQRELYNQWQSGNPTPEHLATLKQVVEAVNEQL